MFQPTVLVNSVEGTDNQLRNPHSNRPNNQYLPPSPPIQEHNRRDCRKEVNYTDHSSGKQINRITRQTNGFEDLRRIVDNCIDACKLLNNLQKTGDDKTAVEVADDEKLFVLFCGEDEAGGYAGEFGFDHFAVKDASCFDFEEFEADARVGGVDAAESDQGLEGFFFAA